MAEGNPQRQSNRSRQPGFWVSGDDFVHWNRDGDGQAFIGGRWRKIDPDDLTRVRNGDGTIDLVVKENGRSAILLHVDPMVPDLRADARGTAAATPFESAHLNRMLAAVTTGDAAGASNIAREFARSAQGMEFLERGYELLDRQQGGLQCMGQQSADQGPHSEPQRV